MSIVSELDTGRLEAPKACVPTRGIDVDALGGQLRSCAGWECRPARAFLSPGRRWISAGIRQSFGALETAERRTKYGKEEKRLRRGRW